MTQPEKFDLVILGGGTGSTVAPWAFAPKENVSPWYVSAMGHPFAFCHAKIHGIID
jgi:hypothetical protein